MDVPSDQANSTAASPLRATGIVALGSVVTLAMSVVTAKAFALLIGPAGVGLWGLMLAMVNVATVIAWVGVPTSVVRWIASRPRGGAGVPSVALTATIVSIVAGVAVALVLVVARVPLAELVLGSVDRADALPILGIAVFAATVAGVQIGILNGEHRVSAVTAVHVTTAIGAAAAGIGLVVAFGVRGLAPALLVTFAIQAAVSASLAWRTRGGGAAKADSGVAFGLVREGLPIGISQLASAGALLLVPLIVLQLLSPHEVGLYRAASAISTGYLAFFLAALTQDFLPRVSSAGTAHETIELVERRMRLVMGIAAPIILGMLAIGPFLLEVLYSDEFVPAFDLFKWQLIGDLIRLPAWVLAFVLIAGARPVAYLGYELAVATLLVGATWLGISIGALAGAGMAYAVTQVVTYALVWWIVRRRLNTVPGRLQGVVVGTAALSAAILAVGPPSGLRITLFGVAAVVLAVTAWPRLYRLHRSGDL